MVAVGIEAMNVFGGPRISMSWIWPDIETWTSPDLKIC